MKKAYSRWIELDTSKFWSIGRATIPFIHRHVPLIENLTITLNGPLITVNMPMPPSYPAGKMRAGIVVPRNSVWVISRNFDIDVQDFLIGYLDMNHKGAEFKISKGHSHNQNDVMINGKKVLGQICFERGGQTYYGCFFNIRMTSRDRTDLLIGMSDDRNFYADKAEAIGSICDEVTDFDENRFISLLEDQFMVFKCPEWKKAEVL